MSMSEVELLRHQLQPAQVQHQQTLQYSRSLTTKSPVTKEHILQILVKGLNKNRASNVDGDDVGADHDCGDTVSVAHTTTQAPTPSQTPRTDIEAPTPTLSVDRTTTDDHADSDCEDSDGSHQRRLGLIRYRSLRDHNGRYYLVVKIR